MHGTYHGRGFTVLAVNAWDNEDTKTVNDFAKKRKIDLNYPILLKGNAAARDWGVRSIPANFVIDREGNVVKRMAEISGRRLPKVEALIERLLR